jgi:phosphopantothenoylcysteine synthetase/decarboxylase
MKNSSRIPRISQSPLLRLRVLITAGPTREYWDPVRYFTNSSTGAMGIALAEEAARRGAEVTLILGPTPLRNEEFEVRKKEPLFRKTNFKIPHSAFRIVDVVSAWDMFEAVKKNLAGTDIFVGSAAVVDYHPAIWSAKKVKRRKPAIMLRLQSNPDIIAMVGHHPRWRPKLVIGFALETDHLLENARRKLFQKRLDWVVANNETAMASATSEAVLLSRWGHLIPVSKMNKKALAKKIWDRIL